MPRSAIATTSAWSRPRPRRREAAEVVAAANPDVVVCDLWLDGQPDGLDVLAQIVAGGPTAPRVLVLSGFDQPSFLRAAFEGGAAGYLSKAAPGRGDRRRRSSPSPPGRAGSRT